MEDTILRVENISKTYPGVRALKNVSLTIRKGEVRALVGENGAGKSTLIKCIMGAETPDAGGSIKLNCDGVWREPKNAVESKNLGMHANYQHVNIARELSIAENYFLGRIPKTPLGTVDWRKMYSESQKIIDKFEMNVVPRDTISSLPVAMQAMVTISKISINENIRLVIFDEPTALLENDKVEILFRYIRELKSQGVSVIYISHRLEEIIDICDSVTILKDGSYVDTKPISECTKESLISMMVGREMSDIYNIRHFPAGKELLRVENFNSPGVFKDISFKVHAGEILGFFGLVGAGRSEVMRAVIGLDKKTSGDVYVKGDKKAIKNPRQAMDSGIGMLTEDRRYDGLALPLSVKVNVNMSSYGMISKAGIISLKKEEERAQEYKRRIAIKTPNTKQLVENLSGGNQQKVVIAKLLCLDPDVLIFDEPTVGVDVGAKQEIFKLMESLTAEGKCIILISSYLPEVMSLSDRMIVMHEGNIMGELDSDALRNVTEEDILRMVSLKEE